jgi:DNA-directed RNA polymerase subunit L
LESSVSQTINITTNAGGYIKSKNANEKKYASLSLKIPSGKLQPVMEKISQLGKVTDKNISTRDVTENYIDTKTRLKNKIVLRDKLKKLLDKAKTVKDIIAIEKELNRIQSDIDSLQGRMKYLKNKTDYARLEVEMERKALLGPLGYLFKGFWWGIEKLFVIRY